MKKIFFFTLVSIGFSLTACAQKIEASKVPALVKESFTRQFPGVVPKWEKEDEKYEAGFKKAGQEMSVLFEANGTIAELEMEIPVASLAEVIKSYINIHYKGAGIIGAAKITLATGKIEYEAAIKGKDIIFDANGNFIKEVAD